MIQIAYLRVPAALDQLRLKVINMFLPETWDLFLEGYKDV